MSTDDQGQPRYFAAAPARVRVYPSSWAFLDEDPTRKASNGVPGDIGGWDVADGFRLAESTQPGTPDSEWRISVINRDVYAALRRYPAAPRLTFEGPVWLIDQVPQHLGSSVYDSPLFNLMEEVGILKHEPDSLLRASHLIQSAFAFARDAAADRSRRAGATPQA